MMQHWRSRGNLSRELGDTAHAWDTFSTGVENSWRDAAHSPNHTEGEIRRRDETASPFMVQHKGLDYKGGSEGVERGSVFDSMLGLRQKSPREPRPAPLYQDTFGLGRADRGGAFEEFRVNL